MGLENALGGVAHRLERVADGPEGRIVVDESIAVGNAFVGIFDHFGIIAQRFLGIDFGEHGVGHTAAQACFVAAVGRGILLGVEKIGLDGFIGFFLGVLGGEVGVIHFADVLRGDVAGRCGDDRDVAPEAHHVEPYEGAEKAGLGFVDVLLGLADTAVGDLVDVGD